MDEYIEKHIYHVGKRLKHELTGLEIKLLSPARNGWLVQCLGAAPDYNVNMSSDDLTRRFRDVTE